MRTFIRSIQLARTAPVLRQCSMRDCKWWDRHFIGIDERARAQKQQTNGTKETHRGSPMVRSGRGFRWIQWDRVRPFARSYCYATRDPRPPTNATRTHAPLWQKPTIWTWKGRSDCQAKRTEWAKRTGKKRALAVHVAAAAAADNKHAGNAISLFLCEDN